MRDHRTAAARRALHRGVAGLATGLLCATPVGTVAARGAAQILSLAGYRYGYRLD